MDVLSNWLAPSVGRLLRVHLARTGGQWGVNISSRDTIMLRHMMAGGCWVRAAGFEPFRFEPGDVLLIRATPHELLSAMDQPSEPVEIFNRNLSVRKGPVTDEFICAAYDTGFAQSTFPPLPPLVRIPAAQIAENPRFTALLTAVREECRSPIVGSDVMVGHLMEALLLSTLREAYPLCGDERWITSMRDPFVVKALQLMHDDFARRWTVESLAESVGLSRAVLARRFTQDVGMPPLTYLSSWRMKMAARCLANRSDGLAQIAVWVGYESEASFSRAFKREFGMAPDEFRRLEKEVIRRTDKVADFKPANLDSQIARPSG